MDPQRFGDYVLLERVAVGGMAEVFRARLARQGGVQRQVCIKRVHPKHSADPSFSAMFIDEARIGVTLSHGNVVPVFDFGCVDGLYYLAMEYVEGKDLAQIAARARIAQIRWPVGVVLFLVREILEGLDYAHERCDESGRPLRIVHRDVSPANVLCADQGEVKIMDFGIARADSRELETRTGVVKGTPGYMAPEQAAGHRPDRRADVYSVGVILWELLQGERAPRDAKPFGPLADPALGALVERALAQEPDDRFASARALHEALGTFLSARGLLPSSRDLRDFIEEVWRTPAPSGDWRYRDSVPPSSASTAAAPDEAAAEHRAAPTASATAEGTENVGSVAPSPSRFAQKVRPRRRGAVVGALTAVTAMAALGLALSPSSPTRLRRPIVPARHSGNVHVITVPTGALASLDDAAPVLTPARFDAISAGTHRVSIEKEGFEPVVRGLVVLAGETSSIELPLHPRRAVLMIAAVPAGARITVDGTDRGLSPAEIAGLDPDAPHRVELALDGYEPFRTDLRLGRGSAEELAPRLRALPRGTLWVNVSDWAEVYLDGERIGNTPIVGRSVSAGTHRLECKNPHRRLDKRLSITIRPRAETRIFPW